MRYSISLVETLRKIVVFAAGVDQKEAVCTAGHREPSRFQCPQLVGGALGTLDVSSHFCTVFIFWKTTSIFFNRISGPVAEGHLASFTHINLFL